MLPKIYEGSVKDIRGPVRVAGNAGGALAGGTLEDAVVFDYTDAYSVFDWGRMPDSLEGKGQALAAIAADWFERLEQPEFWKEFSRTPEALALRKGNRFGVQFNELGEELQSSGLRTHYLGACSADSGDAEVRAMPTSEAKGPFSQLVVRRVSIARPQPSTVLGRAVYDYNPTRQSPLPRLIPLEVVFRFGCPEGSSLLERVAKDPGTMASIGFGDVRVEAGAAWPFPVLELFTKLESTDRPLSISEALAISGVPAGLFQQMLFKTAWIAGALRAICAQKEIELADGKLEWALSPDGGLWLVDAIGPDELRLLRGRVQLSKEFLRAHYRKTPWYAALSQAKKDAGNRGTSDWKKSVTQAPPALPPEKRELASQVYLSLANALTSREWFPRAWPLQKVIAELQKCPD